MRYITIATIVVLLFTNKLVAEQLAWVQEPKLTFEERGKQWTVTFELSALSDVEVAIVDPSSGTVIRHLAAGVLGPKAPPPLIADSRVQRIPWDGKDDYQSDVAKPQLLEVRVRAGMSVSLDQIVGGDPYAYYSEEMGDNDHSPWGICGLEAKPDGKVYVWGHSSNLGPPALRQYDINGDYLQTLFPMPAGKDVSAMQGWGINVKPDGTYAPKFNRLTDPSLTTTLLDTNLRMARLLPTPDKNRLTFWRTGAKADSLEMLTMKTDGTIASDEADRLLGTLVKDPPLPLGPVAPDSHIVHSMVGPVFTCFAPDGKSFYLSGIFSATTRYGTILEIPSEGFWRDGQIWKVDLETRTAKGFFALDAKTMATVKDLKSRLAALGGRNTYSALHGIAVDKAGNVFVADRLNQRITVLDSSCKVIRHIPIKYPDSIALSNRTNALYVTTRFGDEHFGQGEVALVKFNDWREDDEPVETIPLSTTGFTGHHQHSFVVACDAEQATNVWVAHTRIPVCVYRDDGAQLKLLKDFYRVDGAQRCLGFDRMQVDPKTEDVYLQDAHDVVWKLADWKRPRFLKIPLQTASIAIDSRQRHIYSRLLRDGSTSNSVGRVARFHLDTDDYPPANYGKTGTNTVTEKMHYEWCFEGNSDKGIAVAPNGNLAVVGKAQDGLRVFAGSVAKLPWKGIKIADLPNNAGGVRFDLTGNLYVGYVDKKPTIPLFGFENDRHLAGMGRIHKYTPTGTLASGNLFPKAPTGPSQTYDVLYGAFETQCVTRSPRFGVDGYGRIYYPTNIAPRVTVMDNAGNEILHFGTYGNRDSIGGLAGDAVPTKGIPLAFPNSVDATDNYIYVADMVNLRLLRLKKSFQLDNGS